MPAEKNAETILHKGKQMAIEQYKVIDTYLIYVNNDDNLDEAVTLKAVVLRLEGSELYRIRYSHTMMCP